MTDGLGIDGAIFGHLVECALVTAAGLVKVSDRARGTGHPERQVTRTPSERREDATETESTA